MAKLENYVELAQQTMREISAMGKIGARFWRRLPTYINMAFTTN